MEKLILTGVATGLLFCGLGTELHATPITYEMTGIIDNTWNEEHIETWVNLKVGDEFQGNLIYDNENGVGFTSIDFMFNNSSLTIGNTRQFVGFSPYSPSFALVGNMNVTPTNEGALVDGSSYIGFNEWDVTQSSDNLYNTTGDLHLLFSVTSGDYASMNMAFTISSKHYPIPEPSTMLYISTGLACLAGIRHRRKMNIFPIPF